MLEVKAVATQLGERNFYWNFTLATGQLMAIVGPSGVGKSTLLQVLMGLQTPSGGDVCWHGETLLRTPVAERPFGILFQSHNLFEHLSVALNLALGVNPHARLNAPQRRLMQQAAERFGIATLLKRLPGDLSGGERQRVALARVFLQQKPVLLLDEPFSSLDPALRAEGLRAVVDMQQELGCTVLLVTHHLDEMRSVADQVLQAHSSERWTC